MPVISGKKEPCGCEERSVKAQQKGLSERTHHLLNKSGDEVTEEGADGDAELFADIAGSPAKHTAENVTPADVAGHAAIADGEGEGADVVGDDAVGGVDSVDILLAELAGVRASVGELLDAGEEGEEDVGVVVGSLVLEDRDETLESHSSVDVLGRKCAEGVVGLAVVLDEDEVPDLQRSEQKRSA